MIYNLPIWNWVVFFFIYIPIVILWVAALVSMITRPDISGWGKLGWTIFIFALPLIGALTYIALYPKEAVEMEKSQTYRRAA
ncbi:MAG TPA: hypothetical protein ENH19_03725 [Actinobacteria bacterium]|nr:hypothetical protein [Actinomycetes bacterium]HEX21741.1 hypothetical protein [Actinomycetota bacterium]